MLTADEYIQTRLLVQLEYYERQSASNKRKFLGCSVVAIASSTAVPIIVIVTGERVVIAMAGALSAFAIAIQALYQWRENWLEFRSTAEALRREQMLYETRTGPYAHLSESGIAGVLTTRVEDILATEHRTWRATQQPSS